MSNFKYVAQVKNGNIVLNEVRPFRGKLQVLSGDYAGKTVRVVSTKSRTMLKSDYGHVYDPKGQEKITHKAIYMNMRTSGYSIGILVNTLEQAEQALANQQATSVAYYD